MNAFTPEPWHDFFGAQVGASAALTGLVIVAISINIATIIKNRLLSGRAAETVVLLTGVLPLYHHDERRWIHVAITLGASLPTVACGVSLLLGEGGGFYWLVPAIVVALLGGITNSWILLAEILR